MPTLRMDSTLDRKFPSVIDMEKAAIRRMPRFIRDYVTHGMGRGDGVRRNRDDLRGIELMPTYLHAPSEPEIAVNLLGGRYAAPFGVAPVGAGGAAWPKSAEALATAAREHEIPFIASTFAIASLEELRRRAGDMGWFQLYVSSDANLRDDLIARAARAGYETLVVTVDIPVATRRDHDTRNQLSFPLRFTPRILGDIARCPAWAAANMRRFLIEGMPKFKNLVPYLERAASFAEQQAVMSSFLSCPVSEETLSVIRDKWKGKLVVKGVLDTAEALLCRDVGCDALIISNHGGRQLEAAPSAVKVLPDIRAAVGSNFPLIADGGVRTGLDICRYLAIGADFVLLGRGFYYAVAAMGEAGAGHVMNVLSEEVTGAMKQLGCQKFHELPARVVS